MTTPLWQGQPITPGWWWLQFPDGPGPRHWDGTFWDRGSYFFTAEDFADNPILGACAAPGEKVETTKTRHACELLVAAYANGEGDGGSVDWEDLDLAHEAAVEALAETDPHREARSVLNGLLEWAEHTGGWDAPCWQRARAYRDRLFPD